MKAKHTMDLTSGSVVKKLLVFALPILATNLLQQFYNAADTVIVGKFANETALAAVGSTGSLINLLLNLFLGLAVGSNVVCANHYGARDKEGLQRCMHTSVVLGLICGLFIAIVGFVLARPLLLLMGSPINVIDQATLYIRIYFCGVPASVVYNFASGILRAHGDTKRPMVILSVCGILNVLLNLVFVILLHMDVAGVALATIISQYLSTASALYLLFNPKGECAMQLRKLQLNKKTTRDIVAVGLPSGINGIVFSLSNVILQSTVNSFGDIAMAGDAAAGSITGFVYLIMAAFGVASVSFAGQCRGAKKFDRIDQLMKWSILISIGLVCLAALLVTAIPRVLLGFYTNSNEVIEAGMTKLLLLSWCYMIYPISEVAVGCMRGMGYSTAPTVLNLCGICMPRLLWVFLVFPLNPTLPMLYICYPVSWLISALLQLCCYLRCRKKLRSALPA